MPFINQIISYIDETLKAGTLNKKKFQPTKFNGLSTDIVRKKDASKPPEILPGVVSALGKLTPISPDDKYAVQTYHKIISNAYSFENKSYGDANEIKSISEMMLVVFSNSKLTGIAKELLEPVVLFGLPQKLSAEIFTALKISSCLITPLSSNMRHVEVFRQEFPQADYFLNEQMSMFLIRYKVEIKFSQTCVNHCICG